MKQKKIIFYAAIFILLIAVLGGFYIYKEYNRPNKNLTFVQPDFSVTGINLLQEFLESDSIASHKYLGKVLEVKGIVKSISSDENNFYSITIGDTTSLSSIRCRLDSTENEKIKTFKRAAVISMKGVCTGFLIDEFGIGSDVLLERCVLTSINK